MKKSNGSKKKRNVIIIIAVVLFILLLVLLLSGSDEEMSDTVDEEVVISEEDSSIDNEDSSDSMSDFTSRDFSSEEEFPLGTAAELEGKIVVVSIFLNDNTTSWDFDSAADNETIQKLSRNMAMGMDWIVEQGKKYGKDIEFIYNWDDDAELFYVIDIDCDFSTGENQIAEVKMLLDENFVEVSNKLMDRYSADNIIYAMYLNENENTNMVCHAMPFNGTELGYDMPYEPICLTNYVYGAEQGPATYAHEMLHLFGAPDYYDVDEMGNNYGMTPEFVEYCENNMKNEIMYSTYDPYTNTIPKDGVTNDFTDLTAYYVGWIDSADLVDEFGLGASQHH